MATSRMQGRADRLEPTSPDSGAHHEGEEGRVGGREEAPPSPRGGRPRAAVYRGSSRRKCLGGKPVRIRNTTPRWLSLSTRSCSSPVTGTAR